MHIVEVRRDTGDVAGPMTRMRSWLDDHKIAPRLFRFDDSRFRLEFATERETMAFASAFDGQIVGSSEPGACAA